jgi:hypothetical protein
MIGFEWNDEKGITGILSGSHSHQTSYAILFYSSQGDGVFDQVPGNR